MDTPQAPTSDSSESSLTTEQAGLAFASMLDPEPPKEEETPVEAPAEPEAPAEEEAEPAADGDEIVTVLVDGKPIELTKAQIAEAHKSGLRQADYTKKTTELAEQRKAAEAETAKAREERANYLQGLTKAQAVLEAQLQQQQNIDWEKLLETDPVEYLKQQHLAQARQAKLQETYQARHQIELQTKAEHEVALKAHIASQQDELFAKIPEWKDEAKRKAGASELRDYLKTQGLSEQEIFSVTDHRAIVQSYKAMKYDQMMAKASAAAKKIATTPQRVERSAGGEAQSVDKRTAAYQRLSKSGRVEDAGAVFASLMS